MASFQVIPLFQIMPNPHPQRSWGPVGNRSFWVWEDEKAMYANK